MKILVIGGGGREHALVWKLKQSPRVNGLTDAFRERNWAVVGPSRKAAQLEGSKIFSKMFLERHRIPTAKMYGAYDSPAAVYGALLSVSWPVVIKADGLCAGKGVFLAPDLEAAKDFVARVMEKNELGPGGKRIVLE